MGTPCTSSAMNSVTLKLFQKKGFEECSEAVLANRNKEMYVTSGMVYFWNSSFFIHNVD